MPLNRSRFGVRPTTNGRLDRGLSPPDRRHGANLPAVARATGAQCGLRGRPTRSDELSKFKGWPLRTVANIQIDAQRERKFRDDLKARLEASGLPVFVAPDGLLIEYQNSERCLLIVENRTGK